MTGVAASATITGWMKEGQNTGLRITLIFIISTSIKTNFELILV